MKLLRVGQQIELPPGYVEDYISKKPVKGTPEEIEATQVFSRRLVEEYNYPVKHIQTRPQFRVKDTPSSNENKGYPIDIAVFNNDIRTYDNLFMVVECKRKTRNEGLQQLKIYMRLSSAQLGVWFNGKEHAYIQKILDKNGNTKWRELPNIPKYGQRIEDIGMYKRKDLQPPSDLKVVFRDIRNHLAGMSTGVTRDQAFAQEIMNILFCKIYDETNTAPDDEVTVRAGVNEPAEQVRERLVKYFGEKVKKEYSDVFEESDDIRLDAASVVYVVGELQNYCIKDADRDAIGDAFEVFVSDTFRGEEGKFFTPRNVVKMMIEIIDPQVGEKIIDPACGSGGFLIVAMAHIWKKLEDEGKKKNWDIATLTKKKADTASKFLYGIDKDDFLTKVTKAYMALMGDGRGGIFCDNSLKSKSEWKPEIQNKIELGKFDVLVTNPPFGSKIKVEGDILSPYDLAKVWKKDDKTGEWQITSKIRKKQPPQILFIERSLKLLRDGGRMAIVLPESLFGNPSYGYVVEYLKQNSRFLGLVSMPEELFQPDTHAKACVAFVQKNKPTQDYPIFMGVVKWCGHDSRGNKIPHDEVPTIATNYDKIVRQRTAVTNHDRLGFQKNYTQTVNNILIPKYYDPEIQQELQNLSATHDLVAIGKLVDDGVIEKSKNQGLPTGKEIGKLSYGTGTIPFVRSSDLSNWELKIDPKQGVSPDIFMKYKNVCSVREGDILMVRDGTYLVGTTAMITRYDTNILFQSHIYRIRVLKPEVISPYLLLALLNSPIVKKQIKSKQFTQDIIDTLGKRILEVVLPIPKEKATQKDIENSVKNIVQQRADLRNNARQVAIEVLGKKEITTEEEKELMQQL
jgi:type I restriction enzyme M protein